MNDAMRGAQAKLARLLEGDKITAGMYVRVHGEHLIAGRAERVGLSKLRRTKIGFASPVLAATTMVSASSATPVGGKKLPFVEPWSKPSRSFVPSCSTWWQLRLVLYQNFSGAVLVLAIQGYRNKHRPITNSSRAKVGGWLNANSAAIPAPGRATVLLPPFRLRYLGVPEAYPVTVQSTEAAARC